MATNTYEAIATQTLGSAAASVTFSSIPSTYTDLILVLAGSISSANESPCVRLNSDSGSNYSSTFIYGNGTSATSARNALTYLPSSWLFGFSSTNDNNVIFHFQNYSNTTTFKTMLGRHNAAAYGTAATVGLWRNTAAINTITLVTSAGNFNTGSTFSLYGIKAASATSPKATGGTIYSDSTYWYHAFGASGTFTPNQSISADILTVAGGGGSSGLGGGGGGGGYVAAYSNSLTATGYTVTVGAGGAATVSGNNSQFGALTVAIGGGKDGGGSSGLPGSAGGSGGGGGGGQNPPSYSDTGPSNLGGAGTSGQGNAGGRAYAENQKGGGGGGGGATSAGADATIGAGGNGGAGIVFAWPTSNTYSSGGGGAGFNAATGGIGGVNAGNAAGGPDYPVNGSSGVANTGGGGGAGSRGGGLGGAGGSGIVIVRYLKA